MELVNQPYRAKPIQFGLLASVFASVAIRILTDSDPDIPGFFHLNPGFVNFFYWCLGLGAAGIAAFSVPALILAMTSSHRVILTETAISAPRYGYSRLATVVPIRHILDVRLQVIVTQRFLKITHPGGTLTIAEALLPDAAAFDALIASLQRLIPGKMR